MSDATVTIGTNTEQVRKDADKTGKAIGQSLSGHFEQAVGKLARGVVIAKAIGDALKAAADEFNRIKEESKKIGEAGIKGSVGINQTGQRLGMGGSLLGTIRTGSGATTEDQRASFAGSLNEDDGADVNRKAIQLFNEGAFTGAEISKAVKEGSIDELMAGRAKRRSMLGPDFEKSVALEDQRRQQDALKREATASVELGQSAGQRAKDLAQLNSPLAAATAEGITQGVGKVPIVGGILESGARGTQDLMFRLIGAMEETAANTRGGKLNMSGAQDNN